MKKKCPGISEYMKKRWEAEEFRHKMSGKNQSLAVAKGTKGKFNDNPSTIYELSSRTRSKILRRMNLPCSNCGWNEEVCDFHHINGRRIENPHHHSNLSCLCPNCHRLAEKGKITNIISLEQQVGDTWKDFYFG